MLWRIQELPGTHRYELSGTVGCGGGFKQDPEKIICGGPMMGFGMFDLNVPTTKTSTALLALTQDDVSAMEPSPCINCGRCVEACLGTDRSQSAGNLSGAF